MVDALQRRIDNGGDDDANQHKYTLLNASTSELEIGVTSAAHWLLRNNASDGSNYCSHKFTSVNLQQSIDLAFRRQADYDCRVAGQNMEATVPKMHDYLHRDGLPISFDEMMSTHERVKLTDKQAKDLAEKDKLPKAMTKLNEPHSLAKTHALRERKVPHVVLYRGRRLRNRCDIDFTDDESADAIAYAEHALTIFKVHSATSPVVPPTTTALNVYRHWSKTVPVREQRRLNHMQNIHDSKRMARTTTYLQSLREEAINATAFSGLPPTFAEDAHDPTDDVHQPEPLSTTKPLTPATQAYLTTMHRRAHPDAQINAQTDTTSMPHAITQCKNHGITSFPNIDITHEHHHQTRAPHHAAASVHIITQTDLLAALTQPPAQSTPSTDAPTDCTVYNAHDFAKRHNLDDKQTKMFLFAAALLIRHAAKKHRDTWTDATATRMDELLSKHGVHKGQNLVHCGGKGGTGKSKLIHTIRQYANAIDVPIAITGMHGRAAVNVGGTTVHSHSGVMGNITTMKPDPDVQRLALMIIDEMSLCSANLLGKLSMCYNRKNNVTQPKNAKQQPVVMGGIDTFFCGDMSQLQSVGATTLYAKQAMTMSDNRVTSSADTIDARNFFHTGISIWQKRLTHAFMLTKNHRVANDPVGRDYEEFLSNLRMGILRPEHKVKLKSRIISSTNKPPPKATLVYAHNNLVDTANVNAVHVHAMATSSTLYRMHSTIVTAKKDTLSHDHDVYQQPTLPTTAKSNHQKQKAMLSVFDFYLGMPCTFQPTNMYNKFGIANGSKGKIVGTIPALSLLQTYETTQTTATGAQMTITVLKDMPEAILVHNPDFNISIEGLPPHVFPMKPSCAKNIRIQGQLLPATARQFPMRHTFAETCHTLQGTTLNDGMILGQISTTFANYTYTAFSRVPSWNELYILPGLQLGTLLMCQKHNKDLETDRQRLNHLSHATLASIVLT